MTISIEDDFQDSTSEIAIRNSSDLFSFKKEKEHFDPF